MFEYDYVVRSHHATITCWMAFTRIRIINGKPYRYHEIRWRDGNRIRSKSIYLGRDRASGPAPGAAEGPEGFIARNLKVRRHGLPDDETLLAQFNGVVERERQIREQALSKLHEQFGLKLGADNPVPENPQRSSFASPGADTNTAAQGEANSDGGPSSTGVGPDGQDGHS
jgi:hypothetical protein